MLKLHVKSVQHIHQGATNIYGGKHMIKIEVNMAQ